MSPCQTSTICYFHAEIHIQIIWAGGGGRGRRGGRGSSPYQTVTFSLQFVYQIVAAPNLCSLPYSSWQRRPAKPSSSPIIWNICTDTQSVQCSLHHASRVPGGVELIPHRISGNGHRRPREKEDDRYSSQETTRASTPRNKQGNGKRPQ